MIPTCAPASASARARFTATVDLPTPPLPDDTAIVCLTSGIMSAGRWGAAAHLRADLRHAGQPPDELGRHAVDHHLRLRRLGREGEREADLAALDGDVAHEPQRDDVLLALGILDTAERIDDVLLARHTDE